jgi:hypothetical protein
MPEPGPEDQLGAARDAAFGRLEELRESDGTLIRRITIGRTLTRRRRPGTTDESPVRCRGIIEALGMAEVGSSVAMGCR